MIVLLMSYLKHYLNGKVLCKIFCRSENKDWFYWLVKSGEVSAALGFRRFLSLIFLSSDLAKEHRKFKSNLFWLVILKYLQSL